MARGFGVIENPVFVVACRGETAVADAEGVIVGREDAAVLDPVGRVEEVATGVFQEAETVVRRPGAAGGVDEKSAVGAPENLRAFADGHRVAFPRLAGCREKRARGGELARIFHPRDVEVLATIALAGPAGPNEEEIAGAIGESCAIDGPTLCVEAAEQRVIAGGIVGERSENPHAMAGVVAIVGGEVDVVAPVDEVQFRSPEIA